MDTWTHIFFTKYYSTTRSTAGSVGGYRPWIQRANYKCPHTGDCMESYLWLLDCTRGNCIAGITMLILCWEICISVEGYWSRISFLVMSLSHYAAAKSLQSCPTLCNTIEDSPPGSAVPAILQARTLEWIAISFSNAWKWKVKVKSLNHMDCSLPGSSVHGIFQARELEWRAIASSFMSVGHTCSNVVPPD